MGKEFKGADFFACRCATAPRMEWINADPYLCWLLARGWGRMHQGAERLDARGWRPGKLFHCQFSRHGFAIQSPWVCNPRHNRLLTIGLWVHNRATLAARSGRGRPSSQEADAAQVIPRHHSSPVRPRTPVKNVLP